MKDDLSTIEQPGRVYRMQPFVISEHDGWPVHQATTMTDDKGFQPSGFRHPRGMNRAARRKLWRSVANRRQRQEAKDLRWPRIKLTPKASS